MENAVLSNIKDFAVKQLNAEYGYCGEATSSSLIMLNSDDQNGRDIKITIELTEEGVEKPEALQVSDEEAVAHIAQVCHEVNAAYCRSIGDDSQPSWDQAPEWQRESSVNLVKLYLENPDTPESAEHESWMAEKLADGWKYGPEKIPEQKLHNCLVPFDELPAEQKAKSFLLKQTVLSLTS